MGRTKRELSLPADELSEIHNKIQEWALLDFTGFCNTFKISKEQAWVCIELKKKKPKSLQQMATKLKVGKKAVWAIAQKCPK
jgi:hypothetical protein